MKTLILGLANEHAGDDSPGIIAARKLKPEIFPLADVLESSKSGMALMEMICEYERVIIIDVIQQNCIPAGTIIEITPRMLKMIPSPSPRYTGLPEMFERAERMNIKIPREIRIFMVTALDFQEVGAEMCEEVRDAIPELVCRVKLCLQRWESAVCE
jgi:hydrogenase maturation protease